MSRVRGKNTKPELDLRRRLWAHGVRYRVHDKTVPGTPDVSHKGKRIAVFIDGCFWHGCPWHYTPPETNMEFWATKLEANRTRREAVLQNFEEAGWTVYQVWECQLREDLEAVSTALAKVFQGHASAATAYRVTPIRHPSPTKARRRASARTSKVRGKSEACFRYKHGHCRQETCPCPCHL